MALISRLWNQLICIQNGDHINLTVPVYGMKSVFASAEWSDLRLSRNGIIGLLQQGQRILADRGYNYQNFFDVPHGNGNEQQIQKTRVATRLLIGVLNNSVASKIDFVIHCQYIHDFFMLLSIDTAYDTNW